LAKGATITLLFDTTQASTLVVVVWVVATHAPVPATTAQIGTTRAMGNRDIMPGIMHCRMPCR
jgi:hypothetical protein